MRNHDRVKAARARVQRLESVVALRGSAGWDLLANNIERRMRFLREQIESGQTNDEYQRNVGALGELKALMALLPENAQSRLADAQQHLHTLTEGED